MIKSEFPHNGNTGKVENYLPNVKSKTIQPSQKYDSSSMMAGIAWFLSRWDILFSLMIPDLALICHSYFLFEHKKAWLYRGKCVALCLAGCGCFPRFYPPLIDMAITHFFLLFYSLLFKLWNYKHVTSSCSITVILLSKISGIYRIRKFLSLCLSQSDK